MKNKYFSFSEEEFDLILKNKDDAYSSKIISDIKENEAGNLKLSYNQIIKLLKLEVEKNPFGMTYPISYLLIDFLSEKDVDRFVDEYVRLVKSINPTYEFKGYISHNNKKSLKRIIKLGEKVLEEFPDADLSDILSVIPLKYIEGTPLGKKAAEDFKYKIFEMNKKFLDIFKEDNIYEKY